MKGNITEQALLRHLLYSEDLSDYFLKFQHHDIQVLHWRGFDSHCKRSIVVMRMIQFDEDCHEVKNLNKESFFGSLISEQEEGSSCSEGLTGQIFIFTKGAPQEIMKLCKDKHGNSTVEHIREEIEACIN